MPLPLLASVEDLTNTLERPNLSVDRALVALRRASGAIRGELHWNFTRETVVGFQPVVNRYTRSLWLPTLNLVSVGSLTEAGQARTPGTDFAPLTHGELVRASGWWARGFGDIVVTFTHGYTEDDYQWQDMRDLCVAVASRMVGNPQGHASEQTGSEGWTVSNSEAGSLTADEKDQAAKYALTVIA